MARHDPSQDRLIQPNAANQYDVSAADLPLACPMPGMHLWNSHPRVYLAVEAEGTVKCPYCGAMYTLKGGAGRAH
ncbi:MAG: zinc-finger domain-containing protein [Rhodanobacteraceae bacterium]|nr:zinc-finger domain-containing protein [Rhodanobacteraceae bacterium]